MPDTIPSTATTCHNFVFNLPCCLCSRAACEHGTPFSSSIDLANFCFYQCCCFCFIFLWQRVGYDLFSHGADWLVGCLPAGAHIPPVQDKYRSGPIEYGRLCFSPQLLGRLSLLLGISFLYRSYSTEIYREMAALNTFIWSFDLCLMPRETEFLLQQWISVEINFIITRVSVLPKS